MRGDRARRAGHQPCQTAASQVSLEALEQGLVVGSEDGCDSGDVSAWFLTFSVAQQGPALPHCIEKEIEAQSGTGRVWLR